MRKICSMLLVLALLFLTACGEDAAGQSTPSDPVAPMDETALFSDRDKDASYDGSTCATVSLADNASVSSSDAVRIAGNTVTVTDEGTYVLCGTLSSGSIVVEAEATDKLQIVLSGVSVTASGTAALYIKEADKVFVTLAAGTENALSSVGSFIADGDTNVDGAVFSKSDLTFNGTGALTVSAETAHGIVSKDDLKFTGGAFTVKAASHAIAGKDCVCISDGSFLLTAGKDGIHAENAEDAALGYAFLGGGTYTITSEGDGISAAGALQIGGGMYHVVTGGGSENGEKQTSDGWGGFPGHGGGMGRPWSTGTAATAEDSTSIKGIKSGGNLLIRGGTFTVDSADDAVHANASVTVEGGVFTIETGDDGFHADDTLTVMGGKITVTESYEGLEGLHVLVTGGEISLVASDDGINAAGGTDGSGTGGRGGDAFGGRPGMGGGMGGGMSSGSSSGSIVISGGTLYVQASGDGIDANGSLRIEGGHTTVCGPTSGDTATLDYDTTAEITGGTFIGTGAAGMAQSFSESTQGLIALQFGTVAAGSEITVTDEEGNILLAYTPALSMAVFIYSAPQLVSGAEYTVSIGDYSGTFTAS